MHVQYVHYISFDYRYMRSLSTSTNASFHTMIFVNMLWCHGLKALNNGGEWVSSQEHNIKVFSIWELFVPKVELQFHTIHKHQGYARKKNMCHCDH